MTETPCGAFDLFGTYLHLEGDGTAMPIGDPDAFWRDLMSGAPQTAAARRVAGGGWLVSAFHMTEDTHWEMHPEGDELLHLLSGAFDIVLEEQAGERIVPLAPGKLCFVPRGVWHRFKIRAAGDLVAITFGRGTQHRPA